MRIRADQFTGHEPQIGLDTKTDRLNECQSQCDFDFEEQAFGREPPFREDLSPEAEE
jgi:hypothetical protein